MYRLFLGYCALESPFSEILFKTSKVREIPQLQRKAKNVCIIFRRGGKAIFLKYTDFICRFSLILIYDDAVIY